MFGFGIKSKIINTAFSGWDTVSPFLPESDISKKIDYKVKMARLYKEDITQWRVHKAREMGAKVGENCRFYSLNMFSEPYLITIGNNVLISGNVIFVTHDGTVKLWRPEDPSIFGAYGTIEVGDNCFIGMNVVINRNVKIGNNCVIGSGTIIREDVPDDSVVAGNPAKVIFKTAMVKKMLLNSPDTIRADLPTLAEKRAYLEKHFEAKKVKEEKMAAKKAERAAKIAARREVQKAQENT